MRMIGPIVTILEKIETTATMIARRITRGKGMLDMTNRIAIAIRETAPVVIIAVALIMTTDVQRNALVDPTTTRGLR